MSTLTKVLIGCGVVLALALLLALGLVAWGVYWMTTPGPQVPTAFAVGPSATGVVRAGNLAADSGIRAFLATFLAETEKAQRGGGAPQVPPWMRPWFGSAQAESLRQWLPTEATLAFERDAADGRLHPIAALNFRAYVRLIRTMLERMARDSDVVTSVRHRGETILSFKEGPVVCFAGGTLLASDRVDLVRSVLDRAAEAGTSGPVLPPELRELEGRWDSYGVMKDPESAQALVAFLLAAGEGESAPPFPGPLAARFGVDAHSNDELRAFLHLSYASEEEAGAALLALIPTLEERRRAAETDGARLRLSHRLDGTGVVVDLESTGLAAALGRRAAAANREEAARRREER